MRHTMKLLSEPFEKIKSNKKTIEIRLFDEKRQAIKIGDRITSYKLPDLENRIEVEVVDLYKHNTFLDLIKTNSIEDFGYLKNFSTNSLLKSIYKIYSKDQEQRFGVLGIKIKIYSLNFKYYK